MKLKMIPILLLLGIGLFVANSSNAANDSKVDQAAAEQVVLMISKIGTIVYPYDIKLKNAEKAYNQLTAATKPLVLNYNVLKAARSQFNTYELNAANNAKIMAQNNYANNPTADNSKLLTAAVQNEIIVLAKINKQEIVLAKINKQEIEAKNKAVTDILYNAIQYYKQESVAKLQLQKIYTNYLKWSIPRELDYLKPKRYMYIEYKASYFEVLLQDLYNWLKTDAGQSKITNQWQLNLLLNYLIDTPPNQLTQAPQVTTWSYIQDPYYIKYPYEGIITAPQKFVVTWQKSLFGLGDALDDLAAQFTVQRQKDLDSIELNPEKKALLDKIIEIKQRNLRKGRLNPLFYESYMDILKEAIFTLYPKTDPRWKTDRDWQILIERGETVPYKFLWAYEYIDNLYPFQTPKTEQYDILKPLRETFYQTLEEDKNSFGNRFEEFIRKKGKFSEWRQMVQYEYELRTMKIDVDVVTQLKKILIEQLSKYGFERYPLVGGLYQIPKQTT